MQSDLTQSWSDQEHDGYWLAAISARQAYGGGGNALRSCTTPVIIPLDEALQTIKEPNDASLHCSRVQSHGCSMSWCLFDGVAGFILMEHPFLVFLTSLTRGVFLYVGPHRARL